MQQAATFAFACGGKLKLMSNFNGKWQRQQQLICSGNNTGQCMWHTGNSSWQHIKKIYFITIEMLNNLDFISKYKKKCRVAVGIEPVP